MPTPYPTDLPSGPDGFWRYPGWLQADTLALCGGTLAGEFTWMVGGVDYATAFVEVRARGGQAATLAALQDVEASLAFWLLGLGLSAAGSF